MSNKINNIINEVFNLDKMKYLQFNNFSVVNREYNKTQTLSFISNINNYDIQILIAKDTDPDEIDIIIMFKCSNNYDLGVSILEFKEDDIQELKKCGLFNYISIIDFNDIVNYIGSRAEDLIELYYTTINVL